MQLLFTNSEICVIIRTHVKIHKSFDHNGSSCKELLAL